MLSDEYNNSLNKTRRNRVERFRKIPRMQRYKSIKGRHLASSITKKKLKKFSPSPLNRAQQTA